jgi:hypothetical protein
VTTAEIVMLATGAMQTVGLAVVIIKLVWGGASAHYEGIAVVRNDLIARLELQSQNVGNVIANIGDRIHQLEIKSMEFRAIAAETYMRRDAYHKATDEFKRDVKDAHDDLKIEMHAGFKKLEEQIDAVSASIESNRKEVREDRNASKIRGDAR